MKYIIAIFFFAAACIFSSCEKDYSYEGANATGFLKFDAAGNCIPAVLQGTFMRDSAFGVKDYAEVQAEFTTPGTYAILSDTADGFSFLGAGVAEEPGIKTVKLYAKGKPLAAGTFQFTIRMGESSCNFTVTVTRAPGASYTFETSGADCLLPVLSGTYISGYPMTGANTVSLKVHVTETGNYNISTLRVNGVKFKGQGIFTITGSTTVLLTADGTPPVSAIPLTTSYTAAELAGPAVSCAFSVLFPATNNAVFAMNCGQSFTSSLFNQYDPNFTIWQSQVFIPVTVTTPGLYNITASGPPNNVTFAASGMFTTTAPNQFIGLKPVSGSSQIAGDVVYQTSGAAINCPFTVSWKFLKATLDGVPQNFNQSLLGNYEYYAFAPGYNIFELFGYKRNVVTFPLIQNNQFFILLGSTDPGMLQPGSYSVDDNSPYMMEVYYSTPADIFRTKKDGSSHTNPMTIVITLSTANTMKGTFSGRLISSAGNVVDVTNGEFDATVYYP